MQTESLQARVNQTATSGTLTLPAGEFEGPLVVDRPMRIVGTELNGNRVTTIWRLTGPVVSIKAAGVHMECLSIEVTGSGENKTGGADVAVEADIAHDATFSNVAIRGRVDGVGDEGGDWLLPERLNLGHLAPQTAQALQCEVTVPAPCQLTTSIAGLRVFPTHLQPGTNSVSVSVTDLEPGSIVTGAIYVQSPFFIRLIEVLADTFPTSPVGSNGPDQAANTQVQPLIPSESDTGRLNLSILFLVVIVALFVSIGIFLLAHGGPGH